MDTETRGTQVGEFLDDDAFRPRRSVPETVTAPRTGILYKLPRRSPLPAGPKSERLHGRRRTRTIIEGSEGSAVHCLSVALAGVPFVQCVDECRRTDRCRESSWLRGSSSHATGVTSSQPDVAILRNMPSLFLCTQEGRKDETRLQRRRIIPRESQTLTPWGPCSVLCVSRLWT